MRRAFSEATIQAPIETIWRVMTDFSRYHEWNPFIVGVDGAPDQMSVGATFRLHVKWHDGGGASSGELCTRLEPPANGRALFAYRFTGPLDRFGLVRAERVQTLEVKDGAVHYRSEELFRGVLTAFIPLARVQRGFEAHAAALQARATAP